MAKQKSLPKSDQDISTVITNLTDPSGLSGPNSGAPINQSNGQIESIAHPENESSEESDGAESENTNNTDDELTSRTVEKLKFSKSICEALIQNYVMYDRSQEKGKPVYLPNELVDQLKSLSDKYYKRLSARAIVAGLIRTFLIDCDGEETVDEFMVRMRYRKPSEKELERRKLLADNARQIRANKNSSNSKAKSRKRTNKS